MPGRPVDNADRGSDRIQPYESPPAALRPLPDLPGGVRLHRRASYMRMSLALAVTIQHDELAQPTCVSARLARRLPPHRWLDGLRWHVRQPGERFDRAPVRLRSHGH